MDFKYSIKCVEPYDIRTWVDSTIDKYEYLKVLEVAKY